MTNKKKITFSKLSLYVMLVFSLFITQKGFAQDKMTITGYITSAGDKMGIPGANIKIEGSNVSASSDFDGRYKIVAKKGDVIAVSFMGFRTQRTLVGDKVTIDIQLQNEVSEMKEIVVIGYGTQKKKVNTAAATVVSGKNIEQTASADALGALQGQSSGVNITSNSGQPGASMTVNIRGVGTTGNNNPLYVVDGLLVDNGISYLDPSVIERVDILKDASAAAIYGARAANGVILITTKKGKDGKINVSLNSYTGFQRVAKRLDLLNRREYTTILNEARINSGFSPLYSDTQIPTLADTDWQDQMYNDGAIKQNHSLMITGGDKKSTIATGLSYYGQEGFIGSQNNQSNYSRTTFTVNSTSDIIENHLKIGENFTFSNIKNRGVSDGGIYYNSIRAFYNAAPIDNAYDENGGFARSNISIDISNPLGSLYYNNFNENKSNRYVGNVFAEAKFLKNFTYRTSFGIDLNNNNYRSFSPIYSLSSSNNNNISSVTQSSSTTLGWLFENTINYKVGINDTHHFDVLAGFSAKSNGGEWINAQGKNLIFPDFEHAYLNNATDKLTNTVGGGRFEYKMQSYFGRLLYDYKDKYLFSVSIRRDGSSNFGPNNNYGYFPAASVGWNIDKETFFPKNDLVKAVKLRASWGQNGNDQIPAFSYLSTINSINKAYHFGTGQNEVLFVGSAPDVLANPDLKWETSEQTDLGLDMNIANFTLTADYYKKSTKDWLVQASIPLIAGASAPFINGGDVTNKGWELGLDYKTKSGKNWQLTANANLTRNENEVTRIANSEGIIHGESNVLFQGLDEMNRVQVGQPIGYFYGLKTNGIFQNASEVAAGVQPNAQPGDVRFVDLNNDGKIDANDKTKIGNPNPKFTYGMNINLTYKAFDLAIYTYGVSGNQNVFGIHDHTRTYNNYTTEILGRWTTEGSSNTIPRVTYGTDANGNYTKFSDLYVQDGSFFRIKTITLGCDIAKLSQDIKFFSKLRLYVSANNLYTFTKYKGTDPEVGFGGSSWGRGVDVGTYPQSRVYMLGLNANF